MKVWIESDVFPGDIKLFVNGAEVYEGTAVREKDSFYACGYVALPRGEHLLNIDTNAEYKRVFLSDDENLVLEDRLEMAWINRPPDNLFESRNYEYSSDSLKLLKRHGFVFDHPRDAQDSTVPSGVPLGGIGAGKVEITEKGLITAFTGNNNQDSPVYRMPGSYFAVQVSYGSGRTARLLQTVKVDQELVPMAHADADLTFPEAYISFIDGAFPVSVRMHAFSPHIPGNVNDSAIPCAFFRIELENSGLRQVEAHVLASWESLINVGGNMNVPNRGERMLPLCYHTWNHSFVWSDRRVNKHDVVNDEGAGILFYAEDDRGNPNSFGEHLLWTPDKEAIVIPDRSLTEDEYEFSRWFEEGCEGNYAPSCNGEFRAGAVIVKRSINPGETAYADFVLCWYIPHYINSKGKDFGVNYALRYNNVISIKNDIWPRRDALLKGAREIRTILDESNLPKWLIRRLLNDRFVSNTCTWFDKYGNFSVNEAPTGMDGCLGTLDQRTASQGFWTTFFPQLDAVELDLFRQSQGENGLSSHHVGYTSIDLEPSYSINWPDLAASYAIQVYRHWMRTGDDSFLKLHWPYVKATIEWACGFDDANCGIPWIKAGRGTTYDNQHWEGVNAFIASMHIAALILGSDMAEACGEKEYAEQWLKLSQKAANTRMERLWVDLPDGGYIRNANDFVKGEADDSCFIAPLAGDWAVCAAGIKPPIPIGRMRQAIRGVMERCVSEKGLTDQSSRPETPAFMQYPVAYLAAAALYVGDWDSAWRFIEVNDRVLTTPPSTHFIQGLTYNFDGTHTGSLPYYMTAPVTWMFLEALSGLVAHLPKSRLRLSPCMPHVEYRLKIPVFTTTSWMLIEYEYGGKEIQLTLKPLKKLSPFSVKQLEVNIGSNSAAYVKTKGRRFEASRYEEGFAIFHVEFDPGCDDVYIYIVK